MTTKELQELNEQRQTGDSTIEDNNISLNRVRSSEPVVRGPLFDQMRVNGINPAFNNTYGFEDVLAGWGKSRFDRGVYYPGEDVEHRRAIEQSGFSKILNGVIKGGIYAGTTAVETTAGIINGVLAGGAELVDEIGSGRGVNGSQVIGAGVNNFVSRSMAEIQRLSDEWFPNYRTSTERSDKYQDEWIKHIFTPNFIGDSFLKNFGFTAGALIGGAVWTKALSAAAKVALAGDLMKGVTAAASGNAEAMEALNNIRTMIAAGDNAGALKGIQEAIQVIDDAAIRDNFIAAARSINKMSTKQQLFGSVLAAMGEGTMEGVMARNEFMESQTEALRQKFQEEYDGLEQRVIDRYAGDTRYVVAVRSPYDTSTGQLSINVLTPEGKRILQQERQRLGQDYMKKVAYANELGDRIAATTFTWNLPILTVSNTVQFGKMFAGGFDTARRVAKTTGEITRQGEKFIANVAAKNAGKGALAANTVFGVVKMGGAEAAEEMAQGFVSSGAKKVADARLTSFNDDGYDRLAMEQLGDWFGDMMEGGVEYLKDGRNWQEGFLGMVTGLVGIPGKGYVRGQRGGIFQAVADAKENVEYANNAADALNKVVNSDRFQSAFKSYVRHGKYETEQTEALAANDKYAWETASDKELVNAIITFANAGRLQDLYDMADYYASAAESSGEANQDARDAATSAVNESEAKNNPQKINSNIKKQAEDVKKNIKLYNDMYDALTVIAPAGSSRDQLEEMIATSMNIKAFESRFLSMFDEVISELEPYVSAVSKASLKKDGEKTEAEQLSDAKNMYEALTTIFSAIIPNSASANVVSKALGSLAVMDATIQAYGDNELQQKISDMYKLADDRRNFIKKLISLKTTSADQYNKEKTTADKVVMDRKKEAADAQTAGLDSVGSIKNAYRHAEDKDSFIETIRTKAKSHKPSQDFVKLYDTYNGIRKNLEESAPNIVNRKDGGFNYVAEIILDDAYSSASDEKELLDKLANGGASFATVQEVIDRMVQAGNLQEDMALAPMVNALYQAASRAIQNAAIAYRNKLIGSEGRDNIGKSKEVKESDKSKDNDTPTPTKVNEKPTDEKPVEKQQEEKSEEVKADKEDIGPEPKGLATTDEAEADTNSAPVSDSVPEEDAYVKSSNGSAKLGYYQQSIPEIALDIMKEVRKLLKMRKTASEEEMKYIDERLAAIGLPGFVQFDEDGKPVGGEIGYAETYKWLEKRGAFSYIATKLNVDDEVVFAYLPDAPLFNGNKQVVIGVVTERNERGEITQIQPLTILHEMMNADTYIHLNELYDAIKEDYAKTSPKDTLYVFGGLTNPYTSRVFGKRPGLVQYARGKSRPLSDSNVHNEYDPEAPIIVLDHNNRPVLLRGNVDVNKLYLPNIYPWSAPHAGRIYYMAKNGKDTYTPIFVDKAILTADMFENPVDGSFLSKVGKVLSSIDAITEKVSADNLAKSNISLKKKLGELNKYLNLDGKSFEYVIPEEGSAPVLQITWAEVVNAKQGTTAEHSVELAAGDKLTSAFGDLLPTVRLSYRDKYLDVSRKNLEGIIQDKLLICDAKTLRQSGVNFMIDPWNGKDLGNGGAFERILEQPEAQANPHNTVKIPKAEPVVAKDAEMEDTPMPQEVSLDSAAPSDSGPAVEADPALDSLFDATESTIESGVYSDLESLSEDAKARAKALGITTNKQWQSQNEATRKKILGC